MPDGATPSVNGSPVRTLKAGERVLVVGVVEVLRIEGKRVTIRVSQTPAGILATASPQLSAGKHLAPRHPSK